MQLGEDELASESVAEAGVGNTWHKDNDDTHEIVDKDKHDIHKLATISTRESCFDKPFSSAAW